MSEPLLQVREIVQEFTVRGHGNVKGGTLQAVSDVSFDLAAGETLGVVGETGSGKSTLARAVLQDPRPNSGTVTFDGVELSAKRGRELAQLRRRMQMIFQDPYSSLNPTWSVRRIVEEPLVAWGELDRAGRRKRVAELLDRVGLDIDTHGRRRARELSGGQCQRVAIARALAADPLLIIADEAVSSLDVLVQAQVLDLFEQLRNDLELSYLFVAHDLALVKQVCDRVAVMYLGRLCEIGPADAIYETPRHPYTLGLLQAVPTIDPAQRSTVGTGSLDGEPPSPLNPPSGCRFRTRCPRAQARCAAEVPSLQAHPEAGRTVEGHRVACHFPVTDADSRPSNAVSPHATSNEVRT